MTMVTYSSVQPGMDRPFDDFIFVNSCSTGQHDQLVAMMEVEKRYQLTSSDCSVYRHELDSAAGTSSSECHSSIQNMNADWRYRIARWLLSVSNKWIKKFPIEIEIVILIHIIHLVYVLTDYFPRFYQGIG